MNQVDRWMLPDGIEEVLPTYSRDLNFRCSVRDNHPTSGGVSWRDVAFKSTDQAGPFLVTSPNADTDVWTVGDSFEVQLQNFLMQPLRKSFMLETEEKILRIWQKI